MLRKRILPAFVALCMVIALLPVSAFAVDSETLQEQIDRAEGSATIQLTENTTESITIPDGKTITLDLNGKTLTNEAGKHTITVEQGGTLTVQGNGTVDNVSHARAALYNNGTATLNGGKYTRSKENGKNEEDNGGNSYYNILNHGRMTINSGVTVSQSGQYSSMIANGYYNYSGTDNPLSSYIEGTNDPAPTLTINNGTFTGGLNTIKNDDGGNLTINAGTFKNVKQQAVFNVHVATINGGVFQSTSNVLYNRYFAGGQDEGKLTVNGGEFTAPAETDVILRHSGDVVVSGGIFSSDVSEFADSAYECVSVGEKYAIAVKDEADAVATVGGHAFASLPVAVTVAQSGETVALLKSVEGPGVQVIGSSSRTLTIDLGGNTYTVINPTVGSAGTETNGFQLLKGSTITFKNGTLKPGTNAAAILLQNYSNLTLEDVTVDCRNSGCQYALSNNCGNITLKGNTNIYANAGWTAFDLWYGMSTIYEEGVTVTVDETMTGTIQGKIEYGTAKNAADWQQKTKLDIRGGYFDTTFVASSANSLENANIVISGGYFTADPSAYLAKDKAAVESDKAGYIYMVTDANTNAPAEVAPAAPEANVNPDLTGENKTAAEVIQSGLESAVDTVTGDGLTAAAGTVAQKNEVTAETTVEDGKKVLEKLQDLPAVDDSITADRVTIFIQPYMNIAIQDVNVADGNKTLKLEITPMYKTVATTADKAENIKEGVNAVEVGDPQTMTITKPVTVTIPLPRDFIADGTSNVFVEHTKDGRFVAYHAAAVDSGKLTFTNDKGFSEFAVLVDSASASVQFKDKDNEDIGAAASYDLSNVGDTLPTTEAPSGKYFAGWSFAGVDGTYTTLTEELLRALAEQGGTITATPVFRSNGGSVSTNYKITLADTANGTVKASHTSASKGVKVTLTMTPEAYYTVSSVKVTDANGNTVMVSGSGNSYSFTMPAAAVTVTVTFAETECPSDAFIDIDTNKWYHEALDYVINAELMNGVGGNYFNPDGALNRAMLVTMLWRLEGEPAVNYALSFTDVPAESWYTEAVRWAASEGIVDGMTATTFAPANAITRQQMATMLYRYAEYKNYDTTQGGMELREFKDYDQIADWALTAMTWAVNAGLMEGRGNSMLVPEGEATRAEVAKVLMMFCEDIAK